MIEAIVFVSLAWLQVVVLFYCVDEHNGVGYQDDSEGWL